MTDHNIISAEQWPEWADRHCWDENKEGHFYGTEPDTGIWMECTKQSNIPMPAGWDWHVPVMRPTVEESSAVAPAIDLARVRASVQSLLNWIDDWAEGESGIEAITEEAEAVLVALVDGQANVRSSSEHIDSLTPVAHKKLQGLQAEGFIVNGVAIFNPATGQRGLVDYLGYVGWLAGEQPSVAPVGVEGLMQLAREWCMSWGEWAHDADPGCAKENAAEAVLRAALTQALAQQPTKGEGE